MKLTRNEYDENGVFGILTDDNDEVLAQTLEHAYEQQDGTYLSKIPNGQYECIRGTHILQGMKNTFETFCIQVPGHTDILFHIGNYNSDSEGCVLLGKDRTENMILASALAFNDFMAMMTGINNFTLTVS